MWIHLDFTCGVRSSPKIDGENWDVSWNGGIQLTRMSDFTQNHVDLWPSQVVIEAKHTWLVVWTYSTPPKNRGEFVTVGMNFPSQLFLESHKSHVPVTTNQTCLTNQTQVLQRHVGLIDAGTCDPQENRTDQRRCLFNHPEKPGKFDQPKKTHTWFPPDKIAVCGCVWLFWGGKKNTCSSLKHLQKTSKNSQKKNLQPSC